MLDLNLNIASRNRRKDETIDNRQSSMNNEISLITKDDVLNMEKVSDSRFENSLNATLAVKNGNMEALESLLDIYGVPIDTRDEHGNTLFIISCQQGNKRFAKFLLRRGAIINAQNNVGNSALHYLYSYNHTKLANYIIGKGGDDSLLNNDGLTCYEGIDMSILDEL